MMRLLLIDTCGSTGSLALAEDGRVLQQVLLPARSASAQLVGALRAELLAIGWPVRSLSAIAVVNGPGSFTGLRVGLSAAKGVCETAGLPLVTVSRLAVLLAAGAPFEKAIAALDAGRGEFYVRSSDGPEEQLLARADLAALAEAHFLLVAEEDVLASLLDLQPKLLPLCAADALAPALAKLQEGADDVAAADANYVRLARTLYAAWSARAVREA